MRVRHYCRFTLFAGLLALGVLTSPGVRAHAEGACKPDKFEGLVCGEGDGALRVIEQTTSPSKRFAFAWRDRDGLPTAEPDDDTLDNVLLRIEDGAILKKGKYWNTGEVRANRRDEIAVWSPDSNRVIEFYTTRYDTEVIDLYEVGDGRSIAGPLNLLKTVDKAAKTAANRGRRTPVNYAMSVTAETVKFDNNGRLRVHVYLFVPKGDNEKEYEITLAVSGRGSRTVARLVSVRRATAEQ